VNLISRGMSYLPHSRLPSQQIVRSENIINGTVLAVKSLQRNYAMPTNEHYFIEQTDDGRFAVARKARNERAPLFETQQEAIAHAKKLNPDDRQDVERVRNMETGGRDQWRSRG